MLWPTLTLSAIATLFALACFAKRVSLALAAAEPLEETAAGHRSADDASDQVFGDVAQLPRGLIRKRPPTFIDVTITRFGGVHHGESDKL